jgi:hypothetical protein
VLRGTEKAAANYARREENLELVDLGCGDSPHSGEFKESVEVFVDLIKTRFPSSS